MKNFAPFSQLILAASLVAALAGLGCQGEPVGRICFIGGDGGADENIVASPALECQSRTCLHVQGGEQDLCTAECSEDGDCEKVDESPCVQGFACMVPVVVGPFCCKKLCVCKDYLVIPDGGIPSPAACDPGVATNECCNLDGRRGNAADYPQCN
jgi:hypothetical protein